MPGKADSRRLVGWAFLDCADTDLVTRSLKVALQTRRPTAPMLFHSGQESQYANLSFQALLQKQGITASMSLSGNCWDNAVVERFFCTLKVERLRDRAYRSHAEAQADINV